MKKDRLLKMIAESAYNIGYGAKLNFATYDLIEKAPGWLGFISFVIGIFALFVPSLTDNFIAAILLIFSLITLHLGYYQQDKDKYKEAGEALTKHFHDLRKLYYEVQSEDDGTFNSDEFIEKHSSIYDNYIARTFSKQIFISDWIAHFKFFGQMQIDWINEQLHFKFWKDKVPASFKFLLYTLLVIIVIAYLICNNSLYLNFCFKG